MADDLTTKPTFETLLEMVRGMREEMRAGFNAVNKRLEDFDVRLDRMETQLDRTSSAAFETRADVRELKKELREHSPAVK